MLNVSREQCELQAAHSMLEGKIKMCLELHASLFQLQQVHAQALHEIDQLKREIEELKKIDSEVISEVSEIVEN